MAPSMGGSFMCKNDDKIRIKMLLEQQ